MYLTYVKCDRCEGSGVYDTSIPDGQGGFTPIHEDPCSGCNGTKYYERGLVDGQEDVLKILTDVDFIKKKIKKILQHLGLLED